MKRQSPTADASRERTRSTCDARGADGQACRRGPPVAALHEAVGNRGVEALAAGGHLQASRPVSRPDDPAEREAERVAQQVLSDDDPVSDGTVDRAPSGDAPERQPSASTPDGSSSTSSLDRSGSTSSLDRSAFSASGGGRPLPPATREFFEDRFGHDFGAVRVHTDQPATRAARSIDAEAFTVGQDIAFARGAFRPGTRPGRELLAHELTHVVQNAGSGTADRRVFRQVGGGLDLVSPRFADIPAFERVLDGTETLSKGDRGRAVALLQQALVEAGHPLPTYGVDGIYGDETAGAVEAFQQDRPLVPTTGTVGRLTMLALDWRFPEPDAPSTIGGAFPHWVDWSKECLLDIFCEWNEPVIEDLADGTVSLETFTSAHVKVREYDGSDWKETKHYARGYAQTSIKNIGIREDLDCYNAATALYQEWFHIQQPSSLNTRQLEGRAWTAHETWLLAHDLPSTESGFRRTDPTTGRREIDVGAVFAHVESEYSGTGKSGEEVIGHDPSRTDDNGNKTEKIVKVETASGAEKWRKPQKGDSYRIGQNITGRKDVDTSGWTCTADY